ncbi:hypothetical protein FB451DRAFT_1238989 [Mycena latifolia]|nr:hypothetical protein FB451DRAFT_1238989 [Mycena latifolia]
MSVCFSPDGKHIASASADTTARVWEINASGEGPLGDYIRVEDGWVLDPASNLMFWVPPWHRDGLYHPRNTLIIWCQGTTRLDLTRFVHGSEWQQCIDPKFRDTKSDTN